MKFTRILFIAAALAFIGVLVFLVVKMRSVDLDAHNKIVAELRDLKQIDANWNTDVLRSKTGFNTSYDAVANPLPLIAKLEVSLQAQTSALRDSDGEDFKKFLGALAEYKEVMGQKIALVEQFKSQNAILRNSSRYLPLAAHDLSAALRTKIKKSVTRARAEAMVGELATQSMNYILTPDASLLSSITSTLADLRKTTKKSPADLLEQVEMFCAHVETVVRQQDVGEKLLAQLMALPTAQKIDWLTDTFSRWHDRRLLTRQHYGQILIGYTIVLLGILGFLATRLVRSYRVLRKTNANLRKAHDDLKESQSYMIQAEKMSALGQMVAGIAHEINTPLAYVKGTVDLLLEEISSLSKLVDCNVDFTHAMRAQRDGHDLPDQFLQLEKLANDTADSGVMTSMSTLLQDSSQGIERIGDIILTLKNFSRLDRAKVSEFNVREGLESTLLIARNVLKNRVRIVKELENVPNITCSPSQINQVFLNLISNAAQAIPDDREGILTLRTFTKGGDIVCIEIQDNGSGIPRQVLPKIFDPFFTTKEIGKGTGMGLSISYKIITEHGGTISVDTEEDIGTVFSIELPASLPQEISGIEQEDSVLFVD
jgi:two-component system, NtrC family, sensor kinase